MSDTTNIIDALLAYLAAHSRFGFHTALTALVAERDALKQERDKIANDLKWLRLESHAPADRDRELRERLVCAALNGILSEQRGLLNAEYALRAIGLADATLAAMRKGDGDGK